MDFDRDVDSVRSESTKSRHSTCSSASPLSPFSSSRDEFDPECNRTRRIPARFAIDPLHLDCETIEGTDIKFEQEIFNMYQSEGNILCEDNDENVDMLNRHSSSKLHIKHQPQPLYVPYANNALRNKNRYSKNTYTFVESSSLRSAPPASLPSRVSNHDGGPAFDKYHHEQQQQFHQQQQQLHSGQYRCPPAANARGGCEPHESCDVFDEYAMRRQSPSSSIKQRQIPSCVDSTVSLPSSPPPLKSSLYYRSSAKQCNVLSPPVVGSTSMRSPVLTNLVVAVSSPPMASSCIVPPSSKRAKLSAQGEYDERPSKTSNMAKNGPSIELVDEEEEQCMHEWFDLYVKATQACSTLEADFRALEQACNLSTSAGDGSAYASMQRIRNYQELEMQSHHVYGSLLELRDAAIAYVSLEEQTEVTDKITSIQNLQKRLAANVDSLMATTHSKPSNSLTSSLYSSSSAGTASSCVSSITSSTAPALSIGTCESKKRGPNMRVDKEHHERVNEVEAVRIEPKQDVGGKNQVIEDDPLTACLGVSLDAATLSSLSQGSSDKEKETDGSRGDSMIKDIGPDGNADGRLNHNDDDGCGQGNDDEEDKEECDGDEEEQEDAKEGDDEEDDDGVPTGFCATVKNGSNGSEDSGNSNQHDKNSDDKITTSAADEKREDITSNNKNNLLNNISSKNVDNSHANGQHSAPKLSKVMRAMENAVVTQVPPSVSWEAVFGCEEAKKALVEAAMLPLLLPSLFASSPFRQPTSSVLLYGPPGTGKTLLVQAMVTEMEKCLRQQQQQQHVESGRATENDANCTVTLLSARPSTLLSKWFSESEQQLRTLFQLAKAKAPSVIFLDEADSICNKHHEDGNSRRVLTELLLQMNDCLPSHRVLLIAATNKPEVLDPAIIRRFGRRILVPLPCATTRMHLLQHALSTVHHMLTEQEVQALAAATEGASSADLHVLIRHAFMGPVREITPLFAPFSTSFSPPSSLSFVSSPSSSSSVAVTPCPSAVSPSSSLATLFAELRAVSFHDFQVAVRDCSTTAASLLEFDQFAQQRDCPPSTTANVCPPILTASSPPTMMPVSMTTSTPSLSSNSTAVEKS